MLESNLALHAVLDVVDGELGLEGAADEADAIVAGAGALDGLDAAIGTELMIPANVWSATIM